MTLEVAPKDCSHQVGVELCDGSGERFAVVEAVLVDCNDDGTVDGDVRVHERANVWVDGKVGFKIVTLIFVKSAVDTL